MEDDIAALLPVEGEQADEPEQQVDGEQRPDQVEGDDFDENAGDEGADEGADDEPEKDGEDEQQQEDAKEAEKAKSDATEIELDDGRKATLGELKSSYATFTRKTQELHDRERQTIQTAREAVARIAERRAHEAAELARHIEDLVAPGYTDTFLQQMAQSDPQQYFQVKARLDSARDLQQRIRNNVAQLMQQAEEQRGIANQEAERSRAELLASEGAKLSGKKWWNTAFQKQAVAYARRHGIPEQVSSSVAYAGFVEITRKAMAYDEALTKTKGGKVPPKPTVMQPGSNPARGLLSKTKQITAAHERATRTNDKHDIGAYLDKIL